MMELKIENMNGMEFMMYNPMVMKNLFFNGGIRTWSFKNGGYSVSITKSLNPCTIDHISFYRAPLA
jgi:hypothetical protein